MSAAVSDRSAGTHPRASAIMQLWFGPDWATCGKYALSPEYSKRWFMGGPAFDKEIIDNFTTDHEAIAAGAHDSWLQHPVNALAGVILMDQFSRNMYRGTPKAFALDSKALAWAKQLLAEKTCDELPKGQSAFLLLPLEHSEVLEDQEESVKLFHALADEASAAGPDAAAVVGLFTGYVDYAVRHRDVIKQWGRFPHRNLILGRENTPEEAAGLAAGSIAKF